MEAKNVAILRNILGVITGIIVGGLVNMGLIIISGSIITPPEGADVTTSEGLKASMHLFGPEHFIMPFLAHALGTFSGAFVASMIAATHKIKIGIGLGAFFLLGGIMAVFMLPSPLWFVILDLLGAYIPMGWLGGTMALKLKNE